VGKTLMQFEINALASTRAPSYLTELLTLGSILKCRVGALRNLTRDITCVLFETGGNP